MGNQVRAPPSLHLTNQVRILQSVPLFLMIPRPTFIPRLIQLFLTLPQPTPHRSPRTLHLNHPHLDPSKKHLIQQKGQLEQEKPFLVHPLLPHPSLHVWYPRMEFLNLSFVSKRTMSTNVSITWNGRNHLLGTWISWPNYRITSIRCFKQFSILWMKMATITFPTTRLKTKWMSSKRQTKRSLSLLDFPMTNFWIPWRSVMCSCNTRGHSRALGGWTIATCNDSTNIVYLFLRTSWIEI